MSVNESKFATLEYAVTRLELAVVKELQDADILRDAIIQRFEFSLEVAWKYMRFILIGEGIFREDVSSPKKAIQTSIENGLITDGGIWLEMIRHRNMLSHTYDEAAAMEVENKIRTAYVRVLREFVEKVR